MTLQECLTAILNLYQNAQKANREPYGPKEVLQDICKLYVQSNGKYTQYAKQLAEAEIKLAFPPPSKKEEKTETKEATEVKTDIAGDNPSTLANIFNEILFQVKGDLSDDLFAWLQAFCLHHRKQMSKSFFEQTKKLYQKLPIGFIDFQTLHKVLQKTSTSNFDHAYSAIKNFFWGTDQEKIQAILAIFDYKLKELQQKKIAKLDFIDSNNVGIDTLIRIIKPLLWQIDDENLIKTLILDLGSKLDEVRLDETVYKKLLVLLICAPLAVHKDKAILPIRHCLFLLLKEYGSKGIGPIDLLAKMFPICSPEEKLEIAQLVVKVFQDFDPTDTHNAELTVRSFLALCQDELLESLQLEDRQIILKRAIEIRRLHVDHDNYNVLFLAVICRILKTTLITEREAIKKAFAELDPDGRIKNEIIRLHLISFTEKKALAWVLESTDVITQIQSSHVPKLREAKHDPKLHKDLHDLIPLLSPPDKQDLATTLVTLFKPSDFFETKMEDKAFLEFVANITRTFELLDEKPSPDVIKTLVKSVQESPENSDSKADSKGDSKQEPKLVRQLARDSLQNLFGKTKFSHLLAHWHLPAKELSLEKITERLNALEEFFAPQGRQLLMAQKNRDALFFYACEEFVKLAKNLFKLRSPTSKNKQLDDLCNKVLSLLYLLTLDENYSKSTEATRIIATVFLRLINHIPQDVRILQLLSHIENLTQHILHLLAKNSGIKKHLNLETLTDHDYQALLKLCSLASDLIAQAPSELQETLLQKIFNGLRDIKGKVDEKCYLILADALGMLYSKLPYQELIAKHLPDANVIDVIFSYLDDSAQHMQKPSYR